jgi:hypothetical protein
VEVVLLQQTPRVLLGLTDHRQAEVAEALMLVAEVVGQAPKQPFPLVTRQAELP